MIVVVVERVPDGLRGRLRRWMLEVQVGVFVGKLSRRVSGEVWSLIRQQVGDGAAVMIQPAQNEQGYSFEIAGRPTRSLFDSDGLCLVARERKKRT